MLTFLCCLIAVVLFLLAAFGVSPRISLGWLGLAFFAFPSLVATWPG